MSTNSVADIDERKRLKNEAPFKLTIVWKNVIGFIILHVLSLYGAYPFFFLVQWKTVAWMLFIGWLSEIGITVGAHRLFTHRSYTASRGLRIFLVACQTISGQNCLYVWVRDHRQHHKYSDTDADPHNSKRGFFFSHMGWLMVRKHPDVITKGKTIDMSDMEADPIVMLQKKYYKSLYALMALFIPVAVPCLAWGEDVWDSLLVVYLFRYILSLHVTWSVNSAAHLWGMRPYNKNLPPVQNLWVSFFTGGEGWHNFHHQFPWDYRAAEYGMRLNLNSHVIDFLARNGWATNLRSASKGTVKKMVEKYGDNSHELFGTDENTIDCDTSSSLSGAESGAESDIVNQKPGGTLPTPRVSVKSG